VPTAQTNLYCTDADVEGLLSALGVRSRLDDDQSGAVETDESARLRQAREYATARVKFYALVHYADEKLASSWLVNDWATTIAAYWLSARRLNTVPDSLRELYEGSDGKGGVLGDLEAVRKKTMIIPDIAFRNVDWPAWSNVTVDPRYRVRQIRVQRQISEKTPTQYPQTVDVIAERTLER
jgi:hypothetical protein